jgi:hypothetical protein
MYEKTYAAGFDLGNSDAGLVVIDERGERQSLVMPSTTALGTLAELDALGVTLGPRDFVYTGQGTELYIGELAVRQAQLASTGRGDISRYWSERSVQTLLTMATALIPDERFTLHAVTGLPIATYLTGKEARDRVKQALAGEWAFWVNGCWHHARIHIERVLMEGAGAGIVYGKAAGLTAIIDVGYRTTDLYVADGQTPLRQFCGGTPIGVGTAADLLNATFERAYKRPLSFLEQRDLLRAYASRGDLAYPELYAGGRPVEGVADLVDDAIDAVGRQLASWLASRLNSGEGGMVAGAFKPGHVLVIGGGAHYFLPHVQGLIAIAETVEHPEEANARGYAAFALANNMPTRTGGYSYATRS